MGFPDLINPKQTIVIALGDPAGIGGGGAEGPWLEGFATLHRTSPGGLSQQPGSGLSALKEHHISGPS